MSAANSSRARDAYLAWQAEIGTDDVVLTAPLPRALLQASRAVAATPADSRTSRSVPSSLPHGGYPAYPAFASDVADAASGAAGFDAASAPGVPAAPAARRGDAPLAPDFFQAIAEKLAAPSSGRSRRATPPPQPGPALPRNPVEDALAAAPDLTAYWSLLEARYSEWFPGATGPLARARGHAAPRLAVVELAPRAEAGASPEVFPGAAGVLLDRMMTAIGLTPGDLYLTSVMKTPPPGRQWALRDTARMLPALFHELRLARCQCVLVLGETCARAVLKTGKGVPDLLKSPVDAGGLSLSATWHPDEMRADESRKKPAWEHLQWLRGLLPARGS